MSEWLCRSYLVKKILSEEGLKLKHVVYERRVLSSTIFLIVLLVVCLYCFRWLFVGTEASVFASAAKSQEELIQSAPAGKEEKGLIVEIGPKPIQTMKLLFFRVNLNGRQVPEKIIIDLSMPGMVMGINRFNLKRVGDSDMYEGKTIIPFCPTGKKLWLAKVIINHVIEKEVLFNVQK